MTTNRHKVFVSYHHEKDQKYREQFERLFSERHNIMVSKSVQMGDIDQGLKTETVRQKIRDEYLGDSTVTLVLIGAETWKRKHVDWEIGSSIRRTKKSPRSGLVGIFLPTYPKYKFLEIEKYNASPTTMLSKIYKTIPPRLYDNVKCGYAKLYKWSTSPSKVIKQVDEAFKNRKIINPDNSYPSFSNNRSANKWS